MSFRENAPPRGRKRGDFNLFEPKEGEAAAKKEHSSRAALQQRVRYIHALLV